VSQQGKSIVSLDQSVNSLNKQLSTIKNDDKSHGKRLISLETRVTATENTLAVTNISLSSTKTSSLNGIAFEIQLQTSSAGNIIIRGAPESIDPLPSKRILNDNHCVSNSLQKLDHPVTLLSIRNIF